MLSFGGFRTLAHRAALGTVEKVPDHMHALHKCDNPPCCNPGHLFAGTQRDNMSDCRAKRRLWMQRPGAARGESNPSSLLTEADVRSIRERVTNGEPRESLALAMRVSRGAIDAIICRRTWAHVEGGEPLPPLAQPMVSADELRSRFGAAVAALLACEEVIGPPGSTLRRKVRARRFELVGIGERAFDAAIAACEAES